MKEFVLTALVVLHASVLHQSICVDSVVFSATEESSVPQPSVSPVPPPMATFSPGIHPGESEFHKKRLTIALVATCASVGTVLVCFLFVWVFNRKSSSNSKQKNSKNSEDCEGGGILLSRWSSDSNRFGFAKSCKKTSAKEGIVSLIDYKMIEKGTNGFKETNILGQGGFGCVYKAKLDSNMFAAVKKLECGGEEAIREFKNEINLLSKIQHPNIVSLHGYSANEDARFIVYELMHNGSLESQLHGSSFGSALTWPMRMKIALDTSRGLEYLHEHCHPPVIHRDLKSSNILLDSNFNAKISDFGLAVTDASDKSVKLSGTVGYVAPEYLLDGQLTEKSDVYAFGVVLLELLFGRKPVEKLAPSECRSIVTWAMPHLTDRTKLPTIIDPAIKDTIDLKHLYQVAAVAVLCVQHEPSYRPLITDVLHSLIPLVPMELGGTLKTNIVSGDRGC